MSDHEQPRQAEREATDWQVIDAVVEAMPPIKIYASLMDGRLEPSVIPTEIVANVIATLAELRREKVLEAARGIVEACEEAMQHSVIDYGDAIGALDQGNQYDDLHILPAINTLLRAAGIPEVK